MWAWQEEHNAHARLTAPVATTSLSSKFKCSMFQYSNVPVFSFCSISMLKCSMLQPFRFQVLLVPEFWCSVCILVFQCSMFSLPVFQNSSFPTLHVLVSQCPSILVIRALVFCFLACQYFSVSVFCSIVLVFQYSDLPSSIVPVSLPVFLSSVVPPVF